MKKTSHSEKSPKPPASKTKYRKKQQFHKKCPFLIYKSDLLCYNFTGIVLRRVIFVMRRGFM